ncbi:ABC transporter ATP-binding protein [Shewanella sp. WXL01]|uniref:ABC transporter ATP-binding protein n=1 Tax=Shewanella sp. WXL01 TaxID=2709721 RepID=UPI0014384C7B|nr:ABC transporter ATP-binding protein [Shewanella sp. WXL01]NKF50896.1 ABC transporter ATP-binding protein [Shewanella sp. WXL01]
MTAISVSAVSWTVGKQLILDDVSLCLDKGKMLGVIGPNGAGKSSLLRCLYRYITPDSGDITLLGKPIEEYSSQSLALNVAVVQQDTPAHVELTVTQLVTMGLTPHKGLMARLTKEDKQQVSDAIEQVGLRDKALQMFNALSGGEKQRVLIARAIVQQPQILVLDEPTNHLDVRYQIQILELVKSLGITVIASIHDLNLASALCDELVMLHQGKVVAHGEPKTVLTESRIGDVFGVCCQVGEHPQNQSPLITYFYGYQGSSDLNTPSYSKHSQLDSEFGSKESAQC